jgi:hypothetical protein
MRCDKVRGLNSVINKTWDRPGLRRSAEWFIPVLLCVVLMGQLFLSIRHLSQTVDESLHLYSAYRYVRCGDLTVSPEHPPLAKLIAVTPLLFLNFDVDCAPTKLEEFVVWNASLQWLYSHDWRRGLPRARMAISVFALGLCLLVWLTARRMFGLGTAIIAGILLVFEPNILAYGALVLTDVPVTCTLFFAVSAFYLWMVRPNASRLLLVCVATGLTLLTKASGAVVIPILCVLAVVGPFGQHLGAGSVFHAVRRNLLALAVTFCVALCIVWIGYGVRYGARPEGARVENAPTDAGWTTRAHFVMRHYHLLPEAYLDGFAGARGISNNSGAAFLAGKFYPRSPWFATPFYLLIRNTSAMLVLFLLGGLGLIVGFSRHPLEWLFLLVPAITYLAICMHSSLVGGVRYLLPAFPFLLVAAAAGCTEMARRWRVIRVAVVCLIVFHAFSSLRAYPNYLSYANEFWGGPTNAYKYIAWPDIGQAHLEAGAYLRRHPSEKCWYLTAFPWNPRIDGVPCSPFGLYLDNEVPVRVQGTVIVSSDLFSYLRPPGIELAAPFRNAVPKDKIGGSALLVYEGDFDTSFAAAWSESQMMNDNLSARRIADALTHGERSIELAPNSVVTRYAYCAALAQAGQANLALKECSTARAFVNSDPLRTDPVYNEIRIAIENQLKGIRVRPNE